MASSVSGTAVAGSLTDQVFDGAPWDFEEGVDFPEGEWGALACKLKALAQMIGGYGSAAEIIYRDKNCKVKQRIFRWQYLARGGWRGGL